MGGKAARPAMNVALGIAGLQGSRGFAADHPMMSRPHEWPSPFVGMDLLSLPRQFVTSASL